MRIISVVLALVALPRLANAAVTVAEPTGGWFGLGRTARAFGMSGLRLALLGAGTAFTMLYIVESGGDCVQEGEDDEWRCPEPNAVWIALGAISLAAGVITAFLDAALVGRAADRANAAWREKNKVSVGVAPVAWSNGHGDGTYGLALSGSF